MPASSGIGLNEVALNPPTVAGTSRQERFEAQLGRLEEWIGENAADCVAEDSVLRLRAAQTGAPEFLSKVITLEMQARSDALTQLWAWANQAKVQRASA